MLLLSGEAQIWQLAVLYALHATASAFFNPAATALVPQVTPRDRLKQANALLGMTRSLAAALGAGLGGALVSLVSTGGAVAFDACTFVVSAACLAALSLRSAGAATRTRFLSELRAGFDEVRRHRWLWLGLINAFLFLMLVVAPFEVIGPVVARRELGGAFAWGLILTGFSVGMLLGGLAHAPGALRTARCSWRGCSSSRRASHRCLLALAAPAWAIALAYMVEGFAAGIFVTSWETALQFHIRPEMLARVGAWDWLGTIGGLPLGYALTGPIVDAVGTGPTLVAVASVSILLALVFVFTSDLRNLRIEGPVPVPNPGVLGV